MKSLIIKVKYWVLSLFSVEMIFQYLSELRPQQWPGYPLEPSIIDPEVMLPRYLPEEALSLMLLSEALFLHQDLSLSVNVNDIFYQAADCEPIQDVDQLWEIYDLMLEHGHLGGILWAAQRRGELPWRGPLRKRIQSLLSDKRSL